jgi:Bacterial virulence protein (VirJ)
MSPARLGICLAAAIVCGACGGLRPVTLDPSRAAHFSTLSASLRGRPIELHLAAPPAPRAADVLVLYASGDGGWFGAAVDMFRAIGDAGFYAVGVSSRSLLHRETAGHDTPGVVDLAADYQALLDQAASTLKLPPDHRVVLTGWSRGASLAVLVGGPRHAPRGLPTTSGSRRCRARRSAIASIRAGV